MPGEGSGSRGRVESPEGLDDPAAIPSGGREKQKRPDHHGLPRIEGGRTHGSVSKGNCTVRTPFCMRARLPSSARRGRSQFGAGRPTGLFSSCAALCRFSARRALSKKSGRLDSNQRPLGPQPSALHTDGDAARFCWLSDAVSLVLSSPSWRADWALGQQIWTGLGGSSPMTSTPSSSGSAD